MTRVGRIYILSPPKAAGTVYKNIFLHNKKFTRSPFVVIYYIIWVIDMEPKKISFVELAQAWKKLQNGSEDAIGNYLYKGLRIQVSKYHSSGTERYMRLYKKRREQGLCIRCGNKVRKINPHTEKLYRLCEYHRE